MRVVCIIQARFNSRRLPGKVLLPLNGIPMLQRIVERLGGSKLVDETIVATSKEKIDDPISEAGFLRESGVRVYRGSLDDVLSRITECAKKTAADVVVRITADCPLIDSALVDAVIERHIHSGADFTTNALEGLETFPDGLDVEVVNFSILDRINQLTLENVYREHVTPYIYKNPSKFRIEHYASDTNHSSFRFTVDDEDDYRFVNELYRVLDERSISNASFFQVMDVLMRNPKLLEINQGKIRNESYLIQINGVDN